MAKPKRIIVTGHKGWVGAEVVQRLLAIYNVDDLSLRCFDSGNCGYNYWKSQWNEFIAEEDTLPPDIIIHIGGLSDSRAGYEDTFEMNFMTTCDIVRFCKVHDVKLLYFSSYNAFDADNPYGFSKFASECLIRTTLNKESYCIFRPFNIYGAYEEQKQHPSIIEQIRTGKLPVIYRNCVRDFVEIQDVVTATIQMVRQWNPGVWDIGTGHGTLIQNLPCLLDVEWDEDKYEDLCPAGIRPIRIADRKNILPNWNAVRIEDHYRCE